MFILEICNNQTFKNIHESAKINSVLAASNAHYAYLYAINIIGGRFELGEKAIAEDGYCSFYYAYAFGRFELGEPAIAKTPSYSYWYAEHVLYGPFPEGEHVIAKYAFISREYTQLVLKRDFYVDGKLICKYEE